MAALSAITARLLAQRVKSRLAYRGDLLASMVSNVLVAGVGLVFLTALFANVPALGGWSAAELRFTWGFAETVVGLYYFAFSGLTVFNVRYILGGELDRVLLRPVDPLLHVLLDNASLEDLPVALLGLAVMAYAAPSLAPVEAWRWALLPLMLLGGLGALGGVLVGLASLGFHVQHRGTAGVGLVFQLSTYSRYPLDLFAWPMRWLLTVVLPLGFAGFYPASLYLSRPEWTPYALATPLVGGLCLWAGWSAWRFGLSRYSSAGG
jgi:ABC-2 type transport system permease protein